MSAFLLLASLWTALGVPPYPIAQRSPYERPADGKEIDTVVLAAAKGEYESAAFQLSPARDMAKVGLVPSDLKGPGGAVIPADEIDLKVVKYWWRPHDSWDTDRFGDVSKLALMPVMLLHDDTLATRDDEKQVNFVRADYPTGPVYLNMRERGRETHFNYALEPVHDAPKLLPLDLRKGEWREFFLILHVPAAATPGDYAGTLAVNENGKACGSLGIRLTVHPFTLPRPRTHYDLDREYLFQMHSMATLGEFVARGKDLAKAERRLAATVRECVRHNITALHGPGEVKALDTDDLGVRTLLIWQREGLPCRTIVGGHAYDDEWLKRKKVGGKFTTPENDAAALKEIIDKRFGPFVDLQVAAVRKYCGPESRFHLYGSDEGGPTTQRRQTAFWRAIHDRGGYVFATTMGPMYREMSWLEDIASVSARCRESYARGWHAGGAQALTYAAPFTGMECPDVWRRTKGIRFYFADFDGLDDYHLFREDFGNIWNGLTPLFTGFRHFHAVFPTEDGVITTIAFEGMREAIDDVRYFSLLKLLARQGIRSGDPAKRAAGRAEIAWLDATDPELVYDLDAFRAEVAKRIVRLQGLVGPLPPEPPAKKPPELPPCTFGTNVPADADLMKTAADFAKADRYDLAVPLYERVRTDAAAPASRRIAAAQEEAVLLAETKRRDRAVAILDEALALVSDRKVRKQLLLARLDAQLTDLVYEERFSAEQIAAAKRTYDEISSLGWDLKGGRAREQCFGAAKRLVAAAGFGGHAALACETADAALALKGLSEAQRGRLGMLKVIACFDAGDRKAVMELAPACVAGIAAAKDLLMERTFYRAWAESAEKTGDLKTAADAYQKLSDLYPDVSDLSKIHKRYKYKAEKLQKMIK